MKKTATGTYGKRIRYVVSDELSTDEIARILGTGIGKPELKWVRFPDKDVKNGMLEAGLSPGVADHLIQMGRNVQSGIGLQH